VPEDGVLGQAEGAGERGDVGRHLAQRPGGGGGRCRPALGALVDQHQAVGVRQRVEVVRELVVVEAGTAVEQEQRVALAPLHDVQPGVADVDETA